MIRSVLVLMCSLTFIENLTRGQIVDMGPNGTGSCLDSQVQPDYFESVRTTWPMPIDTSKAEGVIYPNGKSYSNISLTYTGLYPKANDLGKQYLFSDGHSAPGKLNNLFVSNYSSQVESFDDGFVVRIGAAANKTGTTVISQSTFKPIKKIYPAFLLGHSVGNYTPSNRSGRYFNHTLVILPDGCGTILHAFYCILIPRTQQNCAGDMNFKSLSLWDTPASDCNPGSYNEQATLGAFKVYFDLINCTFRYNYTITEDENAEWFGITQDTQGVHLYSSRKENVFRNNMFHFATLPVYQKILYYTVIPRSIRSPFNDRKAWAAFYIYKLHPLTYLLNFDVEGYITKAVDCGYDDFAQLQCSYENFDVETGVYSVSSFEASPRGEFIEQSVTKECDFSPMLTGTPPPIYDFKRLVFTNCNYNLTKLLSLFQVSEFSCHQVSPSSLATGCYSSLTVDYFAYSTDMSSYLQPGSAGEIVQFNYKQDFSNPTCRVLATVPTNLTTITKPSNYVHLTECYKSTAYGKNYLFNAPGGYTPCLSLASSGFSRDRQSHSQELPDGSFLTTTGSVYSVGSNLQMAFIISVQYGTDTNSVCPMQALRNDTSIEDKLDVCVEYSLHGITGRGVFHNCTSVGLRNQRFVYDTFDNLVGYHSDNGNYYCVRPCVSVPVSVIYDKVSNSHATLFGSVACSHVTTMMSQLSRMTKTNLLARTTPGPLQTTVGCAMGFINSSMIVDECQLPLGQSLCAIPPTTSTRFRRATSGVSDVFQIATLNFTSPLTLAPINSTGFVVAVPTNFTFGVTQEFIETTIQKITVDCKQYVCNGFKKCEDLLKEYGQFCSKINQALHGANLRQDESIANLFSSIKTQNTQPLQAGLNGDFNLTMLQIPQVTTGERKYRSAIEDLLFNKVTIADPGYMQGYDECMQQGPQSARDLICAQYVAGYKVLPPLYDPYMEAAYTSSLLGSIAGASWTAGLSSFAAIPFAQSIFYRLNGVGITQQVLSENQKIIANKFNQALGAMQTGFTTTNLAFSKVQDAVNANAMALSKLAAELSNTFGAISSSISDILARLDTVEQEAQIDRLINGRLTSLNAFVAQQLVRTEAAARSAQLAQDKVNECVKSQSKRNGFCGTGTHIVSFAINAPNGLYFFHVGYQPTSHVNATAAYGLCNTENPPKCIAPIDGYFVLNQTISTVANSDQHWYYTGSSFFHPEPITEANSKYVSMDVKFENLTNRLPPPLLSNSTDMDFKEELEEFFKNVSSQGPNFQEISKINTTLLNLNTELMVLSEVVKQLNESYIDLKELGNYTFYQKWPWYIWLGFIAGLVALALCVFFILCCTGCGTSCLGKLKCNRCCDSYDEYEVEKIHVH
uniref:Spike glycoprotein n=1 Tax=Bat coronavirus HKU5 TaxID=694008 RepID=S4WWR8_BCHK5|nr:spike glycoprotein [Pipistrellus bat coronavirus HKU5]